MQKIKQETRWFLNHFFERLGIKEYVRTVLEKLGGSIATQSLDELAAEFYHRSQPALNDLPPTTSRVLFLAGRAVDQKFPMYDGMVGWALRLRGAQPLYLICDGTLTACELSTINEFPSASAFLDADTPAPCQRCYTPADKLFRAYGWVPEKLSAYFQPEDWQEARALVSSLTMPDCFALEFAGLHIGEHIESTTYRTLFSADLSPDDEVAVKTARRAALSAVVITKAVPRAFAALKPDRVVAHHGIYLTGGIICNYARHNNIPVINWTVPYRRNTVLYSHGDTYHRTMSYEPVDLWRNYPLTPADRDRLAAYLGSHYKSGWDLISYNRDTDDNPQRLVEELQLDPNRPVIGLYTNLAWDARIHYPGIVFPHHAEWLAQTVGHFMDKPDVQLVIRVHPAEVKSGLGPVRERADALINQRYPQLPSHIKVILPDSPLSSYALMRIAQLNVVFGTKLGLEMAALGLPVIVAGEAWYRAKGFTHDPATRAEYFAWLEQPKRFDRLTSDQIDLATRYAYHFYFRRMLTFPSIVYSPNIHYVRSLDDLMPGRYTNLDVICDGILNQRPFNAEAF